MTGQPRDHMAPANKNRRAAAQISCRFKENFSNSNNEKATEVLK